MRGKMKRKMKVRKTTEADLDIVMPIYNRASDFMQQTGNRNQWIDGYPSIDVIKRDIGRGESYVCLNDEGTIVAVFCFMQTADPNYAEIRDGQWLNDEPYGVIHRLASSGDEKGVGAYCFNWCFDKCNNIRVDTHHDNKVMQHLVHKLGYVRCGIIRVENGTDRIAFQKNK